MKKEELIQAVDSIQPDIYMKTRLKAKVSASKPRRINPSKLTKCITALCLAAAVISGAWFAEKETPLSGENESEVSSENIVPEIMKAFIVVASAADETGKSPSTANRTLELHEEYPYGVHLKLVDIRGLSDSQKKKILNELSNELTEYCDDKNFSKGRCCTVGTENYYLSQCSVNEFKLDLEENDNIKSVNVKNTSPYGQIVYAVNKPTFNAPEHGNDITVSGDEFDCETSGFYWDHTAEMEKAFEENISTPFSTFDDTITFTVEYNDGAKAIGVVQIKFDSSGNATAVCRSYKYERAGDVTE